MSELPPRRYSRRRPPSGPRKSIGEAERRIIHEFRQVGSDHYSRNLPEPTPFAKALNRLTEKKYWQPKGPTAEDRIRDAWPQLVGQRLSGKCYPRRISAGVLQVSVKDSIAMGDLTFKKATLLHLIRGLPGLSELKDVRFSMGEEEV